MLDNNSVAVITGVASGIGRALAVRLAAEMMAGIAVTDVNEAGLAETAAMVEATGVPVSFHLTDVSDLKQVQQLAEDVVTRHVSHRVAPAVPSALESLTSVFGMGTGVASPELPPGKKWRHELRRCADVRFVWATGARVGQPVDVLFAIA